jgi:hypothetical protein
MGMNAFVSVRDCLIAVELVLNRPACDGTFSHLWAARDEIAVALGHELEWKEFTASYRIVLSERGYDPVDRTDWTRQHDWLIGKIKAYQQILLKRIEAA